MLTQMTWRIRDMEQRNAPFRSSLTRVFKPIIIPVGNDGYESLEPTQAEFEHNVRCYLTYVMSKEEFNARFKTKKK